MTANTGRVVSFGGNVGDQLRDFKGVWFPREVWLDERLTALEKIILIEIDSLDGESGCYASNEYLAGFCQCSEAKVTGAISKLKKLGYIRLESFDGRRRVLRSCLATSTSQGAKNYDPACEKVGQRVLVENTSKDGKKERKAPDGSYDTIIQDYTHDAKLREAIIEFVKMRKLIKKPLTNHALRLRLADLDKLASDDATKTEIVNNSTANNWQGFYALKEEKRGKDANARGTGRNDELEALGYLRGRTDVTL